VKNGDWQRVKDIVAGALPRAEPQRSAYVAAACGGDAALRAQVESLLAAAVAAADLYESPTLSVVPRTASDASRPKPGAHSLQPNSPEASLAERVRFERRPDRAPGRRRRGAGV
jgi:hypothetical protein